MSRAGPTDIVPEASDIVRNWPRRGRVLRLGRRPQPPFTGGRPRRVEQAAYSQAEGIRKRHAEELLATFERTQVIFENDLARVLAERK